LDNEWDREKKTGTDGVDAKIKEDATRLLRKGHEKG
jgi:hypothetical protein